jgi:hypothetical protein
VAKTRRTTFDKLQRERARQAKQAEKRERRQAKRAGDDTAAGPTSTPLPPPGEPSGAGSDDEANGSA